jgi:hypothetical protein
VAARRRARQRLEEAAEWRWQTMVLCLIYMLIYMLIGCLEEAAEWRWQTMVRGRCHNTHMST